MGLTASRTSLERLSNTARGERRIRDKFQEGGYERRYLAGQGWPAFFAYGQKLLSMSAAAPLIASV
jgi:hypothetical protein